jgi:arylsulfatase A-like enzyme
MPPMSKNYSFPDFVFNALTAGLIAGMVISIIISVVLYFFYAPDFQALSFIPLFAYATGWILTFFIVFCAILAVLAYILTSVFKNRLNIRKKFSFFLSLIISVQFCFWGGLYLNSNILRYSRELKSYLADAAVLAAGLALFFLLYRAIPPMDSIMKKRGYRIFLIAVFLLSIIISFGPNPFSLSSHLPAQPAQTRKDFTSDGRYLSGPVGRASEPLNIILFSIDTLRADGLGCYGNPRNTSPEIDRLAKDSIIFQNALTPSSWTLPSHMSLVTSLYPSVHRCEVLPLWARTVNRLSEHWITLPEILKGFGYFTVAYTDGKFLGSVFNFDQGFDICDDSGGGIEKIADKAIRGLKRYGFDKPFFLFLHCYDVHHYRPPAEYENSFVREYGGRLKSYRQTGNELEARVTANTFYSLDAADVQYLRDLYEAEIKKTDTHFGRILAYLKERGLYENTVIVVTSDHGEEFWEYGRTGHGWSLHQNLLKVPLILKSPTFSNPDRKIHEWAGIIDVAPTILDILDLPIPREFQGVSLLPLIDRVNIPERAFLAEASHLGNQKCLISDGYAYHFNQFPPLGEHLFNWKRFLYVWRNIMHFSKNRLYSLSRDPDEKDNVIAEELETAEYMKKQLLEKVKSNLSRSTAPAGGQEITIDEETRKHLESLGYVN